MDGYLGVFFFHFFKILIFRGVSHEFLPQNEAKNFKARWRPQKWFDLAEILHNCSLGVSLGVFFSFFQNFDFKGAWSQVLAPKRG